MISFNKTKSGELGFFILSLSILGSMVTKIIFYVIQTCRSYSTFGFRPRTRPSSMNPVITQWEAYTRRYPAY